ncbi:MAG: hypothetical protein IJO03_03665 [Clostridia bacterium]|nr:hypothetical protein [Clostridia bacterium]
MANLILQELVPIITAFVIFLNSIGGIFGVVVIPYNPERTEVTLSSNVVSDVDDVLEYYNAAVKKTGFVLGNASYDILNFNYETDKEELSEFMKTYLETYTETIEATSTAVFEVPGEGNISKSDVKSAKMSVKDGKRTITIKVKDYSHDLTDKSNANPITNAFGYSTDISSIFGSNGMPINSGNIEFTYTDCTISCIIDDNSGKIIYGDWDTTSIVEADNLTVTVGDTQVPVGDFNFEMASYTDI